jgi:hypothetical protein
MRTVYSRVARCQRKVRKKIEEALYKKHKSKMFQNDGVYKKETVRRYKKNIGSDEGTQEDQANESSDGDPANKVKISEDQREQVCDRG